MVGVGSTIGTGLFLSSGDVIATAGPGGAVVAYLIGGIIAYPVSYTHLDVYKRQVNVLGSQILCKMIGVFHIIYIEENHFFSVFL